MFYPVSKGVIGSSAIGRYRKLGSGKVRRGAKRKREEFDRGSVVVCGGVPFGRMIFPCSEGRLLPNASKNWGDNAWVASLERGPR